MRLIDADKIVKDDHQHYEYMSDTFYVTVADIEDAPTIDAVPVVRCRECLFCKEKSPSQFWCTNERWPESRVPSIGYCDNGKRKEDTKNEA